MNRLIYILVFLSSTACAELRDFRVEYIAKYQGLPVKAKAVRELYQLDDNRFRLVSSVRSVFINVTETTEFEYSNQQLRPISYAYRRKGLGKKKNEELTFDWDQAQLNHDTNRSPLVVDTLDKLSLQHKLSLYIAEFMRVDEQPSELSYQIADKEKRKTYRFKILDEEVMETPLGPLRTIPIERIRDNKERHTRFWLAIDHKYLLVKAVQTENGRGLELSLVSATVNGVEIAAD